ncbi:sodium:solute symporter family protein [Bythopirellula polymerisocia]|uniref:Sodium/glucose cotransporter n=1 Tax=Bythopirellula polymerisocia TaxID=2528003 RepID=A0A5C6D0A1_9BACT|nr:sodium:solute symporter family protein [Bythopirellula polymerisocia]TWU29254.1 Sodium/glucose cotransporter [Bythopirellula polymerisocia]
MFTLHPIDIGIIFCYLAVTILIGFWISKRASKSIDNYFLGGNTIPWYMLGLSNASGMFDISGTMWMVYLLFVYGLKSVWIPWLWPSFNQIFMMVFLSIWLRRSRVMTGAEWMRFRFGEGRGAQLAHLIVVLFALINVIGFLAYGFIGIGKFAASFLPWQLSTDPDTNVNLYGLIITAITTIYVVKGGMFSVVFTEVLQFFIMTLACVWVGIIAIRETSPELLDQMIPVGWRDLSFGWKLDLDWTGILDAANDKIAADGWEWFSIFFMLMLFKGVLQSMAGPAPNYDMQRVLSARTPREAAMMSGLVSLVLLVPRYMLITGLTVLALCHFSDELAAMGSDVDFELILPLAMREFIPVGLLGLLISALLAAFMSTYAATVNAAPAYVVNDIYKRYINPDASSRTYVWMSYAISIAVVIIGTAFGFFTKSLNDIVQWIVAALYGGYTAANVLKWFWWRFNSYGYFWGMAAGIASAAIVPQLMPSVTPLYSFPLILLVSTLGCIAGSLLTPIDDLEVLKEFYRKVRPWGFWKPIHKLVAQEYPNTIANHSFARDSFNVAVGMIWQTALAVAGIYLVLEDYRSLVISVSVILITSLILKINWYDKLEDYPPDLAHSNSVDDLSGNSSTS